jgi:hypothetical protein
MIVCAAGSMKCPEPEDTERRMMLAARRGQPEAAMAVPREAYMDPREDALVRIGIGHKALFAANSQAIGKKSNAVDCPSPRQRGPQGVLQRFPSFLPMSGGC